MSRGGPYPIVYTLVEITFVDGTTQAFTISASPAISQYLTTQLKDTGALTLRNGNDTLVVVREQLRCFVLREITKPETGAALYAAYNQ